jgi:hypothetical protein
LSFVNIVCPSVNKTAECFASVYILHIARSLLWQQHVLCFLQVQDAFRKGPLDFSWSSHSQTTYMWGVLPPFVDEKNLQGFCVGLISRTLSELGLCFNSISHKPKLWASNILKNFPWSL